MIRARACGTRWRVAAAALLVLAACDGGAEPERAAGSGATPEETSGATVEPPPSANEEFALWPDDDPDAARAAGERVAAGEDPWRQEPEQTALEFARRVLGWTDAAVAGDSAGEPDAVVIASGDEAVSVGLREFPAGVWSVRTVSPRDDIDPSISLSVRGGEAEVGVADLHGAAEVEVRVGYGGQETGRTVREPGTVRLTLPFPTTRPGHFVLLFRDGDGRVVAAMGGALPPGDTAAG